MPAYVADGEAISSTRPQYLLRAAMRGGVFFGVLRGLVIAAEVRAEANLDEDDGALCLV
jgi:hypothetical protein